MRKQLFIFILFSFLLAVASVNAEPKFYSDDPVWEEVDTQDASGVQEWDINLVYDLTVNLFTKPGDKTPNVRAQNINTVDEVPDSSWFTNRIGKKTLTAQDVAKGPDTTNGPASGTWLIVSGKNDGVTPGFTIEDRTGIKWFIKPDPPKYLAMATGTEVAVTKLFWALGFNVPETHIASMRVEDLQIAEDATVKTPSGKRRKMNKGDVNNMLRRAARNTDGSYRVIASKALEGKPLGGFRLHDTRPDDPNDVILHEHRRELRGYFVFAAWTNHVDIKALQSLDTLIKGDGKSYVRHHLLDFSSALGSGSIKPREYWEGYEYLVEKKGHIGADIVTFGFLIEPYRTAPFFKSRAAGRFPKNNADWNPDEWYSRAPNAAFLRARPDDKFWAARKVVAFTDEMIRAAITSGQFNDQASEDFLVSALIERRNAIGRTYLNAINPVIDPALSSDGVLTFGNAAVDTGFGKAPQSYQAVWHKFDNNTGKTDKIGGATGAENKLQAPAGLPQEAGAFVKVEISATSAENESWKEPVSAFFKRTDSGWQLVGFERMQ
ncbi:hypothetical protein L0156_21090 [bacterium]|nr:hypothetical protein [bacterium]